MTEQLSPSRRARRTLNLATAAFISLALLSAGWIALIWIDPWLPVNPWPPPQEDVTPEATPAARAASWRPGQPTATFPPTWTPTATGTPTPTRLPSSTPPPTYTPTATSTPYALRPYTILGMRGQAYPGSEIRIQGTYGRSVEFASHPFIYTSDGLKISGMMNVPQGRGPFPVVILCHGYIDPAKYATGDGTWRQADYLAERGYLTLAPDYRNHAASDKARSFFHIGYAEDVLHLIASLPNLEQADPRRVGIWGHSMGGGVALKAAVVSNSVDAVVLFGAVSADERVNYANGMGNGSGVYGIELLGSPRSNPLVYKRMSPINYLRFSPPLSIHHGQADEIVPAAWSEELYAAALEQAATAELHLYPEGGHTLVGEDWELAMERTIAFLDEHVK